MHSELSRTARVQKTQGQRIWTGGPGEGRFHWSGGVRASEHPPQPESRL